MEDSFNEDIQWSDEKTLQLIELFQDKPVLWDTKNMNYKNIKMKNDAWKQIAIVLKMPDAKDIIKKKMNSLQASYRKIKSRMKTKSGMGTDEVVTSTWFAFKALSFLENRYTPGKTRNTVREDVIFYIKYIFFLKNSYYNIQRHITLKTYIFIYF